MRLVSRIAIALSTLLEKKWVDGQLDDELRGYVEMVTDEKIAAGVPAADARRSTLVELGGMEQVKQTIRDHRAGTSFEVLWQDVGYGWRQLLRNPGFTAAVIGTLALSIGANTAIFSIVNALMLKSLSYPEPERIGTIFFRIDGARQYDGLNDIDGEQWELLRDEVPSVMGAVESEITSGVNLLAGRSVEYVHAARVSAHYFDVLGIRPAMGRGFTEDEDRGHGPNAVILSYGLWRTTFLGDRNLIGQPIHLKGEPYTVVGVLPAGAGTTLNADVYTPLRPSRGQAGGRRRREFPRASSTA